MEVDYKIVSMRNIMIVTGASSGMGSCFAKFLCEEYMADKKNRSDSNSCEMWIFARRNDRLLELKNEIESKTRPSIYGIPCPVIRIFCQDLSGTSGAMFVKSILEEENSREGICISVLVNNAGFGTYGEFASTDTLREMQMIDLNCTSLTGITGYSLPYMKKGSRIINVASLAAYAPLGNFAVYAASKSYVLSFTVALASELKGRGIKVTALCPGSVSTEFANVASKGARKEVLHGKSCEKTVRDALAKSRRGKMISMWALKWKMNSVLCGIFPKTFIAWATYRFGKRPSN